MTAREKIHIPDARTQVSAVRDCLERIMGSPAFRASSRSKQFLSFVVLRKLEGRQDEIKERTIGAEVFGRAADFETSGDSIVRVNANEVRRRLAQYYQDATQSDPVQIVLPPGTYIPKFLPLETAAVAAPPSAPHRPARRGPVKWLGIIVATCAGIAAAFVPLTGQSEFDRFWAPILDVSLPPVLCLPTTDTFQLAPEAAEAWRHLGPGQALNLAPAQVQGYHNWHTSWPVLQATLSISSVLQRKGKTPLLRIGTDVKLDELHGHPVIAIGSFSNPWTRQNVAGLRFTFDRGPSDKESPRIRDARDPRRCWSLSTVYPLPQDKDYAIVTRTYDPGTGTAFLSLAGLHSFGCQAAGEFVSQSAFLKSLAARAPAGWEKMNLQVVLQTDVIGTTPSRPKIADAFFWK